METGADRSLVHMERHLTTLIISHACVTIRNISIRFGQGGKAQNVRKGYWN